MSSTEQERGPIAILAALQEIEETKGFVGTPQEGYRKFLCQNLASQILDQLPEYVGSFAHTIYTEVASTRSVGELWNEIQARDWANNTRNNSSQEHSEYNPN